MIYLSIFFTIAYLMAGIGFYLALVETAKYVDMDFEQMADRQGALLIIVLPLAFMYYICNCLAIICLKE